MMMKQSKKKKQKNNDYFNEYLGKVINGTSSIKDVEDFIKQDIQSIPKIFQNE
jgi:hypothetical protein